MKAATRLFPRSNPDIFQENALSIVFSNVCADPAAENDVDSRCFLERVFDLEFAQVM